MTNDTSEVPADATHQLRVYNQHRWAKVKQVKNKPGFITLYLWKLNGTGWTRNAEAFRQSTVREIAVKQGDENDQQE